MKTGNWKLDVEVEKFNKKCEEKVTLCENTDRGDKDEFRMMVELHGAISMTIIGKADKIIEALKRKRKEGVWGRFESKE